MIEFGKTLKSAREAKGLSVAQVAEATRLLPRIVEDLEKAEFWFCKVGCSVYNFFCKLQ